MNERTADNGVGSGDAVAEADARGKRARGTSFQNESNLLDRCSSLENDKWLATRVLTDTAKFRRMEIAGHIIAKE